MFEEDIKRIKACIKYDDYFSAMEYAILIKENYKNEEKIYFENIINCVKRGNYEKINDLNKNN